MFTRNTKHRRNSDTPRGGAKPAAPPPPKPPRQYVEFNHPTKPKPPEDWEKNAGTESDKRTEELDMLIAEQKETLRKSKDAIRGVVEATAHGREIYRELEKSISRLRRNGRRETLQDVAITLLALAMIAHIVLT